MKETKEFITDLLSHPDEIKIRSILKSNLGEADNLDYKEDWYEDSKLSRDIIAFANSGGGIIIIGIAQNKKTGDIEVKGLNKFTDKSDVHNKVKNYIPNNIEYDIWDYENSDTGDSKLKDKKIQVIYIKSDPKYIPFISRKQGTNIHQNRIYIRKGTQTIEPSYEELQKIINIRIETEFNNSSTLGLEDHIKQLKALYDQIPRNLMDNHLSNAFRNALISSVFIPNPQYPSESFESFILGQIEVKKRIISRLNSKA